MKITFMLTRQGARRAQQQNIRDCRGIAALVVGEGAIINIQTTCSYRFGALRHCHS